MNVKTIGNSLKKTAKVVGVTLNAHSPEILMAVGIVGTVAGTVVACKATTKLDDILEETQEKVIQIKDFDPATVDVEYTENDRKKDLVITYTKGGLEIAKLYGPAFAILSLSVASMLTANNILRKRNFALMAAYTALDKSFKDYRGRVAKKYGDAVEEEIRLGLEKRKVSEELTDENGKTKKVKKDADIVTAEDSTLIELSEDTWSEWDSVMDYNENLVCARQSYLNDLLNASGYLLMSDVKSTFGLFPDAVDYQIGWVRMPDNEVGDNEVDLRWRKSLKEYTDINGNVKYKPVIYLDPNYDGVIVGTKKFTQICEKNKKHR